MSLHPLLQLALEGLDLDLERELKRYRNNLDSENFGENFNLGSEVIRKSAPELIRDNQDFEFAFDSLSDLSTDLNLDEVTLSKPILARGTQDLDISDLDDLALEWESTLDDEFQGQLQAEDFEAEFGQEYKQKSIPPNISIPNVQPKESNPNLLSPLGVIAMVLLLISSATVGYLLVDSSGLYRLIRQEDKPKPVNLSERIQLFQPKVKDSIDIEQIPFVDFTNTTNKANKSNKLNELPLQLPIGLGRTFEAPIRVEPEVEFASQPRESTKVVKSNSQPSNSQIKPQKIDQSKNLEIDPEPTLESTSNPSNFNVGRSPTPISKKLTPIPLTSNPTETNKPLLEPPKPQPNSDVEVKPEVIPEID